MVAYLDCAATTPIDARVADCVMQYLTEDFGNAGSRTHDYGRRARAAVEVARAQIAESVTSEPADVLFTGGATESNNLAILGLTDFARSEKRRHIISSQIEHRAVLEPLRALAAGGFDIELLPPTPGGFVRPEDILRALRPDTLLVSVMHVNNETGVIQPIADIAEALSDHSTYFHVDAAQGFTKVTGLQNKRIDLITVNGHKIFGPKGVGALITRKRGSAYPPLSPMLFGGGQERGLRPGTRPVPLIAGFGLATQLAIEEQKDRRTKCVAFLKAATEGLSPLGPIINGDRDRSVPHILNVCLEGMPSEMVIPALEDLVAVSNGPACTDGYRPSHVLEAMGLSEKRVAASLRLSWSHSTPRVSWNLVVDRLRSIRSATPITRSKG